MNRPILLVNPNLMKPPVTPVGLDYVGQALRDAGHEVVLLDLAWADDVEAAVRSAAACGPLLVGVSVRNLDDCFFASRAFCLEQTRGILDAIRRHTDASLVLGGVGFSIAPQAALRYCAADWGVAGDGEAALASLANAFAQKGDPRSIPGLVYRQGDGCVSNPIQWPDLAAFPVATRDLVDNRRYLAEGGQVGFETKRGCDHSCAYCADPLTKGRRVRLRDPRAVADELEGLVSRGVDCFHTCDAEFNAPPAHALAVCEETARRGLGDRMRWYAYAEPRAFDETLAAAMRRAGCAGINFGVDHANPGVTVTRTWSGPRTCAAGTAWPSCTT
jgi:hypothetical protein